ncbi:CRAL/TRIO domain-containing protein [Chloropicon primus]|nr:CRAL/TRIO domain-containing protein [Chloropicon primus]
MEGKKVGGMTPSTSYHREGEEEAGSDATRYEEAEGSEEGGGGGVGSKLRKGVAEGGRVLKNSVRVLKSLQVPGKKRGSHQEEPAHASSSSEHGDDEKASTPRSPKSPRLSASLSKFSFKKLGAKRLPTRPRRAGRAAANGKDLNAWGLTHEEEGEYLAEFQEELAGKPRVRKEHLEDEKKLLRFLRARNFKVDRAAEMYLKHLEWREEWGVDDILFQEFPERDQLLEYFPQGYHMCDKQGRPIYIQYLGGINVHKVLSFATEETIVKLFIQEYEKFLHLKLPACSEASGKLIETSLTIMDVKGISLKILTKETQRIMKCVTGFVQDNYPEMMGNMIIINAPYIFKVIFNMIKPMLSPRTQSKITVLGTRYMDQLLEYVDPSCIPENIGGTSKYTIFDDIGPWSELAPSITTKEQLGLYRSQQMLKWADGKPDIYKSTFRQAELSELHTVESMQTIVDSDDEGAFVTSRSQGLASPPSAMMEEEEGEWDAVEEKPPLLAWMSGLEKEVWGLRGPGGSPHGCNGTDGAKTTTTATSLVSRIAQLEEQVKSLRGDLAGKPKGVEPSTQIVCRARVRNQPAWIHPSRPLHDSPKSKPAVFDRMLALDGNIASYKLSAAARERGIGAAPRLFSWLGLPKAFTCCLGQGAKAQS